MKLIRLEKRNVILGYCAILNPELVSQKVNRTILLKFKYTPLSTNLINGLINYSKDAQFCVFSAKSSGDYDWIFHFVFDTIEQYELESSNFLQRFAEIIMDYRSYETKTFKLSPYSFLNDNKLTERKILVYKILEAVEKTQFLQDKLQLIVEGLVKFFDGEFSSISIDSLKIGYIAKSGKPIITNDVINDPRIKYPEWAKKEKLESFAGYPLKHKGKIIGVLAMFSKKRLNIGDFELLGVFSDKVSIELSTHFDAQEYLKIK